MHARDVTTTNRNQNRVSLFSMDGGARRRGLDRAMRQRGGGDGVTVSAQDGRRQMAVLGLQGVLRNIWHAWQSLETTVLYTAGRDGGGCATARGGRGNSRSRRCHR
jgi:hypothetical protein